MYRIHQIKLNLGESKDRIPDKILRKIGGRDLSVKEWKIAKESIDARNKGDIKWIYSVDFDVESRGGQKPASLEARLKKAGAEIYQEKKYEVPVVSGCTEAQRPTVIGFGPGGIFAGLILAQAGCRPIIFERGSCVDKRGRDVEKLWNEGILDTESNVQFGEGGAGAFSDGKLTTGIKDVRIKKVLQEFVRFGAPEEILYKQKPHIGTDLLRVVVKNIREEIIRLGGEIHFDTKVEDFLFDDAGELVGLKVRKNLAAGGEAERAAERATDESAVWNADEAIHTIDCQNAILAIGHSARDTFRTLEKHNAAMEQKPFSIGVRVEHPQEVIDIAQYGKPSQELGLPPAEYKVSYRCKKDDSPESGRGVYSFCMCPGGQVILASSQQGGVVVNGMSLHARDSGKANSALLCDVRTDDFGSDYVLAGVEFQEKYERHAYRSAGSRYAAPAATWGALRDGKAPHVEGCLPEFAVAALRQAMPELGKKLKGFDADDTKVYAVETRSSSPVRILRGKDGQSLNLKGLYPCGEGAGYAGGITSAAVDGIKQAEAVLANLRLLSEI